LAKGVQEAWSITAASNGSSDSNINFAEGQSPASVNNSARALMATVKSWWEQISGGATHGGAGNAYTLTSSSPGAIAAYANGMRFLWKPNATSSGSVTLNVDGVGAKKVYRGDGTTQAGSGDIISGVLLDVVYLSALDAAAGGFQIVGMNVLAYQPKDPQLDALAGMTPNAGGVTYWTSSTAVSEIVTTSDSRAFMAAANYAAMRTLLSLGTAALVNTGTSGGTVPLLNASATITNSWTFGNGKFFLGDSDDSHGLQFRCTSNLTGTRSFNLDPGDSDRTLAMSGNLTVGGTSSINGTALVQGGQIPVSVETSGTLTSASRNRVVQMSGDCTINDAVFTANDWIIFTNNSGSTRQIIQDTGMTLRLHGTTTTGTRVVAVRGGAPVNFNSDSDATVFGDVT
jgi:hypothetical protein